MPSSPLYHKLFMVFTAYCAIPLALLSPGDDITECQCSEWMQLMILRSCVAYNSVWYWLGSWLTLIEVVHSRRHMESGIGLRRTWTGMISLCLSWKTYVLDAIEPARTLLRCRNRTVPPVWFFQYGSSGRQRWLLPPPCWAKWRPAA